MMPWSIAIIDDSGKVKDAIQHAYKRGIEVFDDAEQLLERLKKDKSYYCDGVIINPVNTGRILNPYLTVKEIVTAKPSLPIIIIKNDIKIDRSQFSKEARISIVPIETDFYSRVQHILQS